MSHISVIKLPDNSTYDIKDNNAIPASQKGAANGIAPLNGSSQIDSTYLPSYVDDVIEGYYYNEKFWEDSEHTIEITGEAGKIYINLETSPATTYRYSGSTFVQIGSGGSIVTITRDLTSGVKSATINVNGTGFDIYSTEDTTYSAGTGISLSGTAFSVKTGYTTSGNNRAVQVDDDGNLYVVQTDTNTHRPIQMNGTQILGDNTTALNLKAGTNVTLSNSSGIVTIKAANNTSSNISISTQSISLGAIAKSTAKTGSTAVSGSTGFTARCIAGWNFSGSGTSWVSPIYLYINQTNQTIEWGVRNYNTSSALGSDAKLNVLVFYSKNT